MLFVPLYLIAATPPGLVGAQAVAIGAGALALGPPFDEIGLPAPWRGAFTIAYAASTMLWTAALYDFHASTLVVPFLLLGITAALRFAFSGGSG